MNDQATDLVMSLIPKRITPEEAYLGGLDCGQHGANEHNCHFSIFSSPENTVEWERGKADGADNV